MSQTELSNLKVEQTGISGLDTMLGGGIPTGGVIILIGVPGSGKTILSQQLCFSWLNRPATEAGATPKKVLFFTTFSEPHSKMINHLTPFDFFEPARINQDFKILSLSSVSKQGFKKVGDVIIETVIREKAQLVVIDSLGSLEIEDPGELKQLVYRLSGQLHALNATAIISLARAYHNSEVEPDLTFADGIIGLSSHNAGMRKLRRAEVLKMRGMNHLLGLHPYFINQEGLTFLPRLETWLPASVDYPVSTERLGFGLPELEVLLGGGLLRYSSSVLAGSIGTGKTLSGIYFLREGARRGEKGLYLGFYESKEQLLQKASNLGLDLQPYVDNGDITLLNFSPVEVEPDLIADRLAREVRQRNISRLIVDGFEVIERVCRVEGRSQDFTSAFVNFFRTQKVTTIYTHDIGKIIGTELDLNQTPFAAQAENLLLLKHVEYKNRLYRVLTVLKMRDSAYDPTIRQYTIEDGSGITILQPLESAEGLLSGLAGTLGSSAPAQVQVPSRRPE